MAEKTKKRNVFVFVKKYLKELFSEIKKVTWPTPKQIVKNSSIVLVVVIISSLVLFGLDLLFTKGFQLFIDILQKIF